MNNHHLPHHARHKPMRGRGGAAITPGLVISVTFNLIFLLLLTYQWKMTGIDSETDQDAALVAQLDEVLKNSERAMQGMHANVAEVQRKLDTVQRLVQQELDAPPLVVHASPAHTYQQWQHDKRPPDTTTTQPTLTRQLQQPTTTSNDRVWLTIGIPTIPRPGVDYLTPTLETLVHELPADPSDPMYANIRVVVMNNKPGQHEVFEGIRKRLLDGEDYFAAKGGVYLELVDNPGTVADPAPPDLPDPDDLNNPTDRPGREVRRQTCDLVTLLEHALPLSHYYMFMEDDFTSCLNAIRVVHYAVTKLNTVPSLRGWFALRVSYGMNGVVMRNSDLAMFSQYLRNHTVRLPPDLLWLEWFQGKHEAAQHIGSRFLAVYKYNVFDHIGTISSFTVRPNRPKWPACFDPMANAWSLHMKERFSRRCRRSDLTPCPEDDSEEEWTKHAWEWPIEGAPGLMTGSKEHTKMTLQHRMQTRESVRKSSKSGEETGGEGRGGGGGGGEQQGGNVGGGGREQQGGEGGGQVQPPPTHQQEGL